MPSTVIKSFDYNVASRVLTIRFISGSLYEYYDVPEPVAEAFRSFREKGVYYNTHIKSNYRFKRVGN